MSVLLENYDLYMKTLEVSPGDDAVAVKKAFRLKIKKHHPDTSRSQNDADNARTLIEAYQAFKKGVPEIMVEGRAADSGLFHKANQYRDRPTQTTIRAKTTEEIGRETGKRMYAEIFADRPIPNPFKSENIVESWDDLSDLIWGGDKNTQIYGEHISVNELIKNHGRQKTSTPIQPNEYEFPGNDSRHIFGESKNMLQTAEENLKDVVYHFDEHVKRKFSKSWMKDYVLALGQVQIRFRDVSRRHPAFSARALRRVRQIGELIAEIKMSVR